MRVIYNLLVTALGVLLAEKLVPGISVSGFWTAVLAAAVLAVLNVTLGFVLKVLTFPLTVLTFGLFLLVVNAWVFWSASFIKGFYVDGFGSAFFGALIVTLVSMLGRRLIKSKASC